MCKFFKTISLFFFGGGRFWLQIGVYFTFLQTFFFHYIIHEHFTRIFSYHIFVFKILNHFQFYQKKKKKKKKKKNFKMRKKKTKQFLIERKKSKHMYDKPKHQNLPCNLKYKHLQNNLQIIQNFLQFFCK
jgi:hypothetical protein